MGAAKLRRETKGGRRLGSLLEDGLSYKDGDRRDHPQDANLLQPTGRAREGSKDLERTRHRGQRNPRAIGGMRFFCGECIVDLI